MQLEKKTFTISSMRFLHLSEFTPRLLPVIRIAILCWNFKRIVVWFAIWLLANFFTNAMDIYKNFIANINLQNFVHAYKFTIFLD